MNIAENIKGKWNSRCYLNAFKHAKATGSKIYVGIIATPHGGRGMTGFGTTTHFWNVSDNKIIDTSLGSKYLKQKEVVFFGKEVKEKYPSSTKMWDAEFKPILDESTWEIQGFNEIPNHLIKLN